MKPILLFLGAFVLCISCVLAEPPSNGVSFQLQAEEWATTQQARVVIGFNGTFPSEELINLNKKILDNLSKISSTAVWHITHIDRSQDRSGLDKVYIQAEARLPESDSLSMKKKIKDINKPGAIFGIEEMDFSPSLSEIQMVKSNLRSKIYELVKMELNALNKVYESQRYHLYSLEFEEKFSIPLMANPLSLSGKGALRQSIQRAENQVLSVSNKIILTANVRFTTKDETSSSDNIKK